MATDAQNDVYWMQEFTGYPNSYFFSIWNEFANPEAWDGYSCSEIACCVSYKGGNLNKIQVSNYAQGLVNLFTQYLTVGYVPKVGAFIWFDYGDGHGISHTGRVMWFDSNYVHTFEGNVGGLTEQRDYPINSPYIALYGYPAYTDEEFNIYDIRTESPAPDNLPEYNTIGTGGINSNPTGTGAITGADVLYDDEGYAQGRMIEVYNQLFAGNTPNQTDITPTSWVQGGINDSGANASSSSKIRTGYISINDAVIYMTVGSGYRLQLFEYTSNSAGSFILKMPNVYAYFMPDHATNVYKIFINKSHYYRFVINKSGITPSTIPTSFHVYGYSDCFPITTTSDNVFEIFKTSSRYGNWYIIAHDYGFPTGSVPQLGSVGVWKNQITNEFHVGFVEITRNGNWYISDSFSNMPTIIGSFQYQALGNAPNYLPEMINTGDWSLIGFIYPYIVPYPPIGAIPPTSDKFTYKPYFRHMRRMRGN